MHVINTYILLDKNNRYVRMYETAQGFFTERMHAVTGDYLGMEKTQTEAAKLIVQMYKDKLAEIKKNG